MALTFADTHNMIAYLTKSDASEGFDQIIDFLNESSAKYALTINPNIYVSCIKQFWSSVLVKKVNDVTRLQALVDKKMMIITEATIRDALRLNDADSIDCLPNEEIFTELSRMWKGIFWSRYTFEGMIVAQQEDDVANKGAFSVAVNDVPAAADEPTIPSPTLTTPPPPPSQDLPSTSQKLERRNKLKVSKLRRLKRVGTVQRVDTSKDIVINNISKQDKIIANIDVDADVTLKDVADIAKEVVVDAEIKKSADVQGRQAESQAQIYQIDLEHPDKVLSMQDDEIEPAELKEVVEVVTTSKLMTEVVTAASATITTAATLIPAATITAAPSAARRRKGVRNEKEDNDVMRYQALKRKPQTEAQDRKNMMIYLRNMDGFKMDYFKGMSYDDIRQIFKKKFNSNVAFLEMTREQMEEEDSKALKRRSESQAEKVAKKQKLDEEVEELKKHLQIVPNDDDDVYTEATPLGRKLFLSFLSLLRNFDKEDLEVLWELVKERFASSKPKNFSDDFLLTTLTYMFEKPNVQAQVWKNQRTVHGLAKVKSLKLLESCRVHIITFITTQMILLVERRYPLTRFTLDQMLNNVILEVEEESEVSLELLRFESKDPQKPSQAKDKGKGILVGPERLLKRKDHIMMDAKIAKNLKAQMQAEMEKEKRLVLFNNTMKWIEAFVSMDTELVKGSEKARLKEENETAELKRCLEISLEDDDDVTIEATPISSKSLTIIDYKIYKEGKKSYFKIIRADGNSQSYLTFRKMFKNFNGEDLEVLWSIVKAKFKKTKPIDDMDNLLFQTLKTIFEHHVEDNIWKLGLVVAWMVFHQLDPSSTVLVDPAGKRRGVPMVTNDDAEVAQRRLEDKQLEEKTKTDCLVVKQETIHLGIKVGTNITVTGVPGQEGAEGNVTKKKKVNESMKANLGTLLKCESSKGTPIMERASGMETSNSEEGIAAAAAAQQENVAKEDKLDDEEKDDKKGDVDDVDDETESDEDDIYKYKIRVCKDKDEEMLNVKVGDSDKAITVKDTTDVEINSLLEVKIQYEVPHTQSSSMLSIPVYVISEPIVPIPAQESPSIDTITTLHPPSVSTIPSVPQQTTTPIPIPPITTDALCITTVVFESDALFAVQLRVAKLEKDVSKLKKIDLFTEALAALKT
nr:zinc finger, CCHC-type [Tanacetum cinerariifolium]